MTSKHICIRICIRISYPYMYSYSKNKQCFYSYRYFLTEGISVSVSDPYNTNTASLVHNNEIPVRGGHGVLISETETERGRRCAEGTKILQISREIIEKYCILELEPKTRTCPVRVQILTRTGPSKPGLSWSNQDV